MPHNLCVIGVTLTNLFEGNLLCGLLSNHSIPNLTFAATFLLLLRSYSYFVSGMSMLSLTHSLFSFPREGKIENQSNACGHTLRSTTGSQHEKSKKSLKPTRSRVTCSSSQLQQVVQGSHLSPSGITGRQNCLFSSCGVAGDVRVSSATQDVLPSQCTQTRGPNRTSNPDLPCQTLK